MERGDGIEEDRLERGDRQRADFKQLHCVGSHGMGAMILMARWGAIMVGDFREIVAIRLGRHEGIGQHRKSQCGQQN